MDPVLQWLVSSLLSLILSLPSRLFSPDVTAIIFVVACSSFNMVIREDEKTVSVSHKTSIGVLVYLGLVC